MYGDYETDISFAVAQGTLLWQPINFEGLSQTSKLTAFTLCFGVQKRIADR